MDKYDAYKQKVLHVSRTLSEQGYFGTRSGSGGNVSVLVEGEEAVVVTPSGKPYGSMVADDICVVDFGLKKIEARHEPSIETPMHVAVYKHRRDVNAVIHTHQLYASVLAVLDAPIPALFDEVAISVGDKVEIVPYGLSGSPELMANVVAKLGNRCHCYIMQNHGALCVGPDLDKTLTLVEMLEKVAMIYAHALATGRPVTTLPADTAAALLSVVTAKQDMEIARQEKLGKRAG
jgi:ribulose-5-phosphate 4-epimerase/fuculose-1-phosphate aldolase